MSGQSPRSRTIATSSPKFMAVLVGALLATSVALAGAPLKGIDVKLGKNPGGGAAARITDAQGHFDFGVLPKGSYWIALDPGQSGNAVKIAEMEIAITGAIGGRIDKTIPVAATNDLARTPQRDQVVAFSTDGKHSVSGYVLAAP